MIEIKITGNTPLETLTQAALLGYFVWEARSISNAADAILDTELPPDATPATGPAPAAKRPAPDAPVPSTDTPAGAPAKPTDPPARGGAQDGDTPALAPKPATAAYKLEEIRAKGLTAARAHGQPAVKAILDELGATSMTSLALEQYAVFVEKLEGLGEKSA